MTAKRVLVIDDSSSVREQVCATLTEAGFECDEASDGVEGLKKLAVEGSFAAVLCDINMPRMNGIEMVEKLNADPSKPRVPIVMLTTEGQPSLMQRAKVAGARGWIIKPFKPNVLIATVQKMVA